jgi:hypothetical protein
MEPNTTPPDYYGRDPSTEMTTANIKAYYGFRELQKTEQALKRTDYEHTRGMVSRYDLHRGDYYKYGPQPQQASRMAPRFVPNSWKTNDKMMQYEEAEHGGK